MMKRTGEGTGFDMVTMPQAMRERVPTSNFFQRSGYERNPVAIRHNTVAKLLAVTEARVDSNSPNPGPTPLAAPRGRRNPKTNNRGEKHRGGAFSPPPPRGGGGPPRGGGVG